MKLNLKSFLIFGACALSLEASAYTCLYDSIKASNINEQYILDSSPVVTDIQNALMWQTCSVGQDYKNGDCSGQAKNFASWSEALNYVSEYNENLEGYTDWRLPNITELATIVERACFAPAIKLNVFPSTPSAVYYSSTPDKSSETQNSRLIDFSDGTEFESEVNEFRHIRLVRNLN